MEEILKAILTPATPTPQQILLKKMKKSEDSRHLGKYYLHPVINTSEIGKNCSLNFQKELLGTRPAELG